MDKSRTAFAGSEAEHRRAREARRASSRRRLVAAAGIDPATLSLQARRILDWLAEWDEWTTEGLVEILGAVRTTAHPCNDDRRGAAQ